MENRCIKAWYFDFTKTCSVVSSVDGGVIDRNETRKEND